MKKALIIIALVALILGGNSYMNKTDIQNEIDVPTQAVEIVVEEIMEKDGDVMEKEGEDKMMKDGDAMEEHEGDSMEKEDVMMEKEGEV